MYYTLQIHYNNSEKPAVQEMKDLTPGNMEFNQWVKSLRQSLYTTGFNIQTAPGTIKLISPFLVHAAYLIQQEKKFGMD